MLRIGVLGGTFDPVHLAHFELAKQAVEQCKLDKLIVVPCSRPPHRALATASNSQRLDMLKLAFSTLDRVEICDYELNKLSFSYTVETLESLAGRFPAAQFIFCLGEDALQTFTDWHRWQDILSMTHLAVMKRQKLANQGATMNSSREIFTERKVNSVEDLTEKAGQLMEIAGPEMPISATLIRKHIEDCANNPESFKKDPVLSTGLNPAVLGYIVDNRVYQ